jgi:hypothetical protein
MKIKNLLKKRFLQGIDSNIEHAEEVEDSTPYYKKENQDKCKIINKYEDGFLIGDTKYIEVTFLIREDHTGEINPENLIMFRRDYIDNLK